LSVNVQFQVAKRERNLNRRNWNLVTIKKLKVHI